MTPHCIENDGRKCNITDDKGKCLCCGRTPKTKLAAGWSK